MNKNLLITAVFIICSVGGCKNNEDNSFAGSGIIEATEITVSAEAQGKLLSLAVEEGDTVQKDQVIAKIDVEKVALQKDVILADLADISWSEKILEKEIAVAEEMVSQASITLANVQKTRDRISNLFNKNAATKDQLDKAETELALSTSRLHSAEKRLVEIKTRLASLEAKRNKIEASLRLLDSQIEDGSIVCPKDGMVIEKYVEQGEVVNFGMPLCKIADISKVWLKIYVGETMVGKLTVGGEADIRIDSHPGDVFKGRITWISPRAEFTPKNVQTKDSRVDLVYAVKITIENPGGIFKIGMPADAYIEGLQHE